MLFFTPDFLSAVLRLALGLTIIFMGFSLIAKFLLGDSGLAYRFEDAATEAYLAAGICGLVLLFRVRSEGSK